MAVLWYLLTFGRDAMTAALVSRVTVFKVVSNMLHVTLELVLKMSDDVIDHVTLTLQLMFHTDLCRFSRLGVKH